MQTAGLASFQLQYEEKEIIRLKDFFEHFKEVVTQAMIDAAITAEAGTKIEIKAAGAEGKAKIEAKAAAEMVQTIPARWQAYNQFENLAEFVVITLPNTCTSKDVMWANFKVQLFQYFLSADGNANPWESRLFEQAHIREEGENIVVFTHPEFYENNSTAFHKSLKKRVNTDPWNELSALSPYQLGNDNLYHFDMKKYKKEDYPNFRSEQITLFRAEFLEWIDADENIERLVNTLQIPYQKLILTLMGLYTHKFCNLDEEIGADSETKAFQYITSLIDNAITGVTVKEGSMPNLRIALEVCCNAVQEKISQALTHYFRDTEASLTPHDRNAIIDNVLVPTSTRMANWKEINTILSFTDQYRFDCSELKDRDTLDQILLCFQTFTEQLPQNVTDDLYWAGRRRLWKAILASSSLSSTLKDKMQTIDFYQSAIIQAKKDGNYKELFLFKELAIVAILAPASNADIAQYFNCMYDWIQGLSSEDHQDAFHIMSMIFLTKIAKESRGKFLAFALLVQYIYGGLLFVQHANDSLYYHKVALNRPIKQYFKHCMPNIQSALNDIPGIGKSVKDENEYFREFYQAYNFYFECVNAKRALVLQWSFQSMVSPTRLGRLKNIGEELYADNINHPLSRIKRVIWLQVALNFFSEIKMHLQLFYTHKKRADEASVELISPLEKATAKILELILSSQSVSIVEKNKILKYAANFISGENIRCSLLDGVLEECEWASNEKKKHECIESHVPTIVFSNEYVKLFSEENFLAVAQGMLVTQTEDFLRRLSASFSCINILQKHAKYSIFLPRIMDSLFASFVIIYAAVSEGKNLVSESMLTLWNDCIQRVREVAKKSGHYKLVLDGFADACSDIQLIEPENFYQVICFYIVFDKLQKENFKTAFSMLMVKRLLKKYVSYEIDLPEIETLKYALKPATYDLIKNLDKKQQKMMYFLTHCVTEMKKLDDVLVIMVNTDTCYISSIEPISAKDASGAHDGVFSSPSLVGAGVSFDRVTLYWMQSYVAHLQDWYHRQPGASMPMNYPVTFIYQPDSNKAIVKRVDIYETCDRFYNAIVRKDGDIEASYLLRRASKFAQEQKLKVRFEGQAIIDANIQTILFGLKRQHKLIDKKVLKAQFNIKLFEVVLSIVRESMKIMRECGAGTVAITQAFMNPGDIFDDPKILLRCTPEMLIGFCIITCLCQKLREKRDTAFSQVAGLLDYLLDFCSVKNNVDVLGGSQGIVRSGIFARAPSYLRPADLLKIDEDKDKELIFEEEQTCKSRQEACVAWWFKSQKTESNLKVPSAAAAQIS